MSELISTQNLYKNLKDKNLVIFDCSWFMPAENKNPKKNYKKNHIEGAYFFDIEANSNQEKKLPHMVPKFEFFKKKISNYNIHSKSKIVVYSNENIMGASRVWWMFKYFGFKNIYVLNGGLNKWIKENKPTTMSKSLNFKSSFNFKIDKTWLSSKNQILKNIKNPEYLILDARNTNRFNGTEIEPRKGLRSGRIPFSKNIFWKNLTINSGEYLKKKFIKKEFSKYNLKNKNIIFSCGSGISACILSLSMKEVLDIKGSVYDGSCAEWGLNKKLPIEK